MAKRLALLALLAGAGPLEEVFMVSPASGLTANLSNDPATSDTAPAWSPDGARVAFQRSGPVDGIWVLEVAAGTMAFVPHTDHGFQPAWSPDGAGWSSAATPAATPSCGRSAPTAATSPSSPTTPPRTGSRPGRPTASGSRSPARGPAA